MKGRTCSIFILNYNGRELLSRCVPSILKAAGHNGADYEVFVVDNCSTDGSQAFVEENFPEVKVLKARTNDFLFSLNDAVKKVDSECVMLMNNDLYVKEDFIPHLLKHFSDRSVFAVNGKFFTWDEKTLDNVRRYGYFRKGWFHQAPDYSIDFASPTLYVCGGGAAFDRRKFLELGGFDELFRPFYFEDIDICYRAWKRGWKSVYEPKAVLYHKRSATIGRGENRERALIAFQKNYFLFVWKNVGDRRILFSHIIRLPFRIVFWFFAGMKPQAIGFFSALCQLKEVLERRRQAKNFINILSDGEICKIVKGLN